MMYPQQPEKVLVTFPDVAACFSEEEWKLLHEWQKELYRNVMKEIHQALISLGPLITTTVFSLRAKEKEDLCPVSNEGSEGSEDVNHSPSDPNSTSDVSLGINQERKGCLLDCLHSDGLSTGGMKCNSEVSFAIKQERKQCLLKPQDTGRRESNDCFSTDQEASVQEQEAITPIVSFIIKEEEDADYMDQPDFERRDSIGNPIRFDFHNTESEARIVDDLDAEESDTSVISGDGSMSRNRNFGISVKCNDKSPPCKSTTRKVKEKVVQSFDKGTHSINQMWPENDDELRGENTTSLLRGCNQQIQSSSHQRTPNAQRSHTYNECENAIRNVNILPCQSNTLQSQSPCTGSEQTNCQNSSRNGHQRTHTQKSRYTCFECKKRFSAMSKLLNHERTHTGERPYQCIMCGKSFTDKGVLIRHQKIHTGERPYQCSVCMKRFKQMQVLIRHHKIHTGERPYQCIICGKSFSRKETLIRHRTVHVK